VSLPSSQAKQLEQAFQAFSQMSEKLEGSYHKLEDRVAQLTNELSAVHSERMQQLAEKERLADRLARLHEVLPAGVILLDGNGLVTECNPAAEELLGEPLLHQPWLDVIYRAFVNDAGDGVDYTLKDGRRVGITTRPLGSEPGQIVLLMETSEQHVLREMLNRHNRLTTMGEMAASLAHQVRTPLSSALLYMSALNRHNLSDQERTRFVDKVIGRIRHLEHMVNDMLQFARGENFAMERFPLGELLDDLHNTLDPQLRVSSARLRISQNSQGGFLYGNKRALHDVLMNLATNALQACGPLAQLHLEINQGQAGYTEFLLHDNGPGIDDDLQEQLFTPFFTTQSDGTGLGLSVARSIVLAHQGEIWMESSQGNVKADGGCTFGVRIPERGRSENISNISDHQNLDRPIPSGKHFETAPKRAQAVDRQEKNIRDTTKVATPVATSVTTQATIPDTAQATRPGTTQATRPDTTTVTTTRV
jgi:two-component system sensor histidine kinase FlrB